MRATMVVLAMATLCFGLLIAGCQQAQEQPAEQASQTMTEDTGEQMAMVDPVCGMKVTEDSEWTAEYEGETYYFCSEQCRDTFNEDPATYVAKMHEEMMKEEPGEDMPMKEGMGEGGE